MNNGDGFSRYALGSTAPGRPWMVVETNERSFCTQPGNVVTYGEHEEIYEVDFVDNHKQDEQEMS
jgi:hypothetical protein